MKMQQSAIYLSVQKSTSTQVIIKEIPRKEDIDEFL
jgi:hypothetical protein